MSKSEIEAIDGVADALRFVARAILWHGDMTLLAASIGRSWSSDVAERLQAAVDRAALNAACRAAHAGKEG